jgi:hypothetical protein
LFGSVTADQEMVNGTVTLAPAAGAIGVGAGPWAAARPMLAMTTATAHSSVRAGRFFTIGINGLRGGYFEVD